VSGPFFIAIRRLRAPLIFIILIFALSTVGLTLIPGVDSRGNFWRPSLFEAFYFVTYTATTIGFGELPYAFTNLQRLWATAVIYMSVTGWAYLLGSLLGMLQDKGFRAAIVAARFRRAVRRLREPFYLLCGLGETGMTIARSLDVMGYRFVVLDCDERRIQELDLEEFAADPPAFVGDATSPDTLAMAGLLKRECQGLLALTNSDDANLSIAVAARLLHPDLRTICRAHTAQITASMNVLGVAEVINPYREFAERLAIAMTSPDTHRLLAWITGPPGTYLHPRIPAPPGHWIVCGYGRFGSEVVRAIKEAGFDVTIVDPDPGNVQGLEIVHGFGTDPNDLKAAGIGHAEGIVAATDDDTANIVTSIAARQINPQVFVIARQNLVSRRPVFKALGADMTMVSSEIIADECLAILRTRNMSAFLRIVRARDNAWAQDAVERLRSLIGDQAPAFWSCALTEPSAPGFIDAMRRSNWKATVRDLRRDITDRDVFSMCLPLLLMRGGEAIEFPNDDVELAVGDEILFAGSREAERQIVQILRNANTAEYIITGCDRSRSSVVRLMDRQDRRDSGAGA
jgi:voltage-gated potassium channel